MINENSTTNGNDDPTTTASANYNQFVRVGVQLLRLGPLLIYMRFATMMFGKILLSSHPNLSSHSLRYQRLVNRLIFISSLLLSMLVWLIETEFMGFFLKYVIKMTPKLWIIPPRIITESFVALKLCALNSVLRKYEEMAALERDSSPIRYFALELNRIEDILVDFFENCELGRSGYLLVSPIRMSAAELLRQFQRFVDGSLSKRSRDMNSTADDLATLPPYKYRSLNARRSHSVNCIDEFHKFVSHNHKTYAVVRNGGSRPATQQLPMSFELD